jgi:hypothetical protein
MNMFTHVDTHLRTNILSLINHSKYKIKIKLLCLIFYFFILLKVFLNLSALRKL